MVFSNVENSDYDLNQDQVLTILDIIILVNLVLEFNNEY